MSISYRLGFDGFGAISEQPTNRGFLDQIAALQWVAQNIADFGGDLDRVTIAGQSAGEGSVLALVSSPLARGLFRGAIIQSGALSPESAEQSRKKTLLLARMLGVSPTLVGFRSRTADAVQVASDQIESRDARSSLSLLRFVPNLFSSNASDSLTFAPTAEPGILSDQPVEDLIENSVRLLIGTVAHEFTRIALQFDQAVRFIPVRRQIRDRLGDAHELLEEDLGNNGENVAFQAGQLATSLWIRRPAIEAADKNGAPTWVYDFRLPITAEDLTPHCAKLPFVFDALEQKTVAQNLRANLPQSLADSIHGAWVHFIKESAAPWEEWHESHTVRTWDETGAHDGPGYQLEEAIPTDL